MKFEKSKKDREGKSREDSKADMAKDRKQMMKSKGKKPARKGC